MAQYTINIFIDSLSSSSLTVHPGDSVKFQLKRTDVVLVKFYGSEGSPFTDSHFTLDGSSPSMADSVEVVLSNASGKYKYHVEPEERDPPAGTLSGDIDVTPDW